MTTTQRTHIAAKPAVPGESFFFIAIGEAWTDRDKRITVQVDRLPADGIIVLHPIDQGPLRVRIARQLGKLYRFVRRGAA